MYVQTKIHHNNTHTMLSTYTQHNTQSQTAGKIVYM